MQLGNSAGRRVTRNHSHQLSASQTQLGLRAIPFFVEKRSASAGVAVSAKHIKASRILLRSIVRGLVQLTSKPVEIWRLKSVRAKEWGAMFQCAHSLLVLLCCPSFPLSCSHPPGHLIIISFFDLFFVNSFSQWNVTSTLSTG